jgi:hypothetical protein
MSRLYPSWMVGLLEAYPHLRAAKGRGQIQFHDPDETTEPCECAYCRDGLAECGHTAIPKVRVISGGKDRDPLELRQLVADLDRLIDALPGMSREFFHRRYRVGQWVPQETKSLDGRAGIVWQGYGVAEVCRQLRIRSMGDAMRCHDFHLAHMADVLLEWAPDWWQGQVAA